MEPVLSDEAKKILEMIENVSPDDTNTLDEIDARVCFYLNPGEKMYYDGLEDYLIGVRDQHYMRIHSQYTRSRDALKSIRPEGVITTVSYYPEGFEGYAVGAKGQSPRLPTEELAELHAIIQAIEWERNNENNK